MLGPYIAALLFGGVLLAVSLIAGGHEDADLDGDGDADLHVDHDHDAAHGHDGDLGAIGGFLSTFASLRFWTFFLAFGGGTGLALTLAGLPAVATAIAAATMGAVSGALAAWTFRFLGRNQLTSALSAEDFVGRTGKVTVPISPTRPGKVMVAFEDEVKELVALSAGETEGDISLGEEVLVVSMTEGVAKVTPNRPGERRPALAGTVKS